MKIQFMSQWAAESITPDKSMVCISIIRPGENEAKLREGWKDVLKLKFDDVDRLAYHTQRFSLEDAQEIILFMEENKDIETVIVHCMAGISRSAAVARFIGEKYDLSGEFSKIFGYYDLYNKWVYRVLEEVYETKDD